MSSLPSRHDFSNNRDDEQSSTTHLQDESDFLDNPFSSLGSTVAFLALCAFVVTSAYILLTKYRQLRIHKPSSSHTEVVLNIESARAFASGVDIGKSGIWEAESELATADLVDVREGAFISDGDFPPLGMLPYEDTESEEGRVAAYDLEGGLEGRSLQDGNTQEQYFTPATAVIGDNEALWADRKRVGEELDQVRRNLRSRMVRPNAVVVGQVGDSRIAQRRRTTSNRSM